MGTNINNWEKNHLGAAMGQWIHSFVTTRGDCVSSLFGMVDGMLPRPGRRSLLLFAPGTSSIDCHPIRTFNTINGPSSYSLLKYAYNRYIPFSDTPQIPRIIVAHPLNHCVGAVRYVVVCLAVCCRRLLFGDLFCIMR
jgi:hypothetical protein